MHHPSLMNAYNSLHQQYSYQFEIESFHNDSNDVQWYTLREEKLDRRNLKLITFPFYILDILMIIQQTTFRYRTRFHIRLAWSWNTLFIIRSHESLKMTQFFHIGSFCTMEFPLRLFYHKKASLLVTRAFLILPDVLFTAAVVTGPFQLQWFSVQMFTITVPHILLFNLLTKSLLFT